MKKLLLATLVLPLALVACPKEGEQAAPAEGEAAKTTETDEAAPAEGETAKAAEAAPAEGGKVAIEDMGLVIDMPADSKVSEMAGMKMVQGGGAMVHVAKVDPENSMTPKNFEEAKKAAEDYAPIKMVKEEERDDGWLIRFTNEGGAGTNHFVWVRKQIGDTAYKCETTASSTEQADTAEKACLSLAAAG